MVKERWYRHPVGFGRKGLSQLFEGNEMIANLDVFGAVVVNRNMNQTDGALIIAH